MQAFQWQFATIILSCYGVAGKKEQGAGLHEQLDEGGTLGSCPRPQPSSPSVQAPDSARVLRAGSFYDPKTLPSSTAGTGPGHSSGARGMNTVQDPKLEPRTPRQARTEAVLEA